MPSPLQGIRVLGLEQYMSAPYCEMGRMLSAEHALDFSVEYTGVTVLGRRRVLSDAAENGMGCNYFSTNIAPICVWAEITDHHG